MPSARGEAEPVGNTFWSPSACGTLWQLGTGSNGTKGRRSSVAGADVGPICPSSQVSPRAGTWASGKFRISRTVVFVAGPSWRLTEKSSFLRFVDLQNASIPIFL
nr:uncharacterized protein LOC110145086 isoform X2 [Odocoileus virginianus texanus]